MIRLSRRSLLAGASAFAVPSGVVLPVRAEEKVVRFGISMSDVPLTTGQPDRGEQDHDGRSSRDQLPTDPEVRQRVVVHRHSATQPTIGVMALAQSFQGPCAADTLAGGIEPQRQQKSRRCRRVTGAVTPGLDPVLEFAQIKLADIGPDQPRRMVFSNQALDIHRPQRNLVALRFTQPRCSKPWPAAPP